MKGQFFYWTIFLLLITGCDKIYYYPDKPIVNVKTQFIAHRGCGNAAIQSNTYDAAKYGLNNLGKIELDIQLSKDRTIWLSHDVDFPVCNGIDLPCFPEAFDSQIVALDSCLGLSYTFSRLEEVISLIKDSFPECLVSLDVKVWGPCKFTSLEVTGIMNVIAERIVDLANVYQAHKNILVESEVASFLNYLKKLSNNKIECYLTTLGDFERGMLLALKEGYSGISFKYNFDEIITKDHIDLLHKKGIKIQLWTVDEEDEMALALSLNPDYIQTDNIEYAKYLIDEMSEISDNQSNSLTHLGKLYLNCR